MDASSPAIALSIAGSDPSGGAGLQADLKTFAAHGVYGLSALTCSTAQVPGQVAEVAPMSPEHLGTQLDLLFEHLLPRAIKTGMLYSVPLMRAVEEALDRSDCAAPLVIDPVMVATSGDPLLLPEAVDFYREALIPRAALVTPNLDEAAVLLELRSVMERHLIDTAADLFSRFEVPFLLKGGHLKGEEAIDILVTAEGCREFRAPFVSGVSTHGTGCTLSAAITANLACGKPLEEAVAVAKRFVTAAIAGCHRWPGGLEALNHGAGES